MDHYTPAANERQINSHIWKIIKVWMTQLMYSDKPYVDETKAACYLLITENVLLLSEKGVSGLLTVI